MQLLKKKAFPAPQPLKLGGLLGVVQFKIFFLKKKGHAVCREEMTGKVRAGVLRGRGFFTFSPSDRGKMLS